MSTPADRPVSPHRLAELRRSAPGASGRAVSELSSPAGLGGPAAAGGSGHPAVDAVVQAVANVSGLPLADQIAQYEAAHRTLRETLATIDQT